MLNLSDKRERERERQRERERERVEKNEFNKNKLPHSVIFSIASYRNRIRLTFLYGIVSYDFEVIVT